MSRAHSLEAIELIHRDNIDIARRLLYLGFSDDGIDAESAAEFIKNLHVLSAGAGDISIIMNSVGGSVVDGLAIYDAIRACPNHVSIKVLGECVSMGVVILQAADVRTVSPNSSLMYHLGSASYPNDHTSNVEAAVKHNKRLSDAADAIVNTAVRARNPGKKLKDYWVVDRWYSAQEAVAEGLADKVE